MADAYSGWQSSTGEADGGYNVTMSLRIIRGACTRTATSVSFSFGVELQSNQKFNNSISVFYGTDSSGKWLNKRYAFHNPGYTKSQLEASGEWDTRPLPKNKSVYARWPEADTSGWQYQYSDYYCYTYTNDKINANTESVSITIGGAWDAHTPSNSAKMTRTFSIAIPKYIGPVGTGTTTITDNYNNSFTITATAGTPGVNNSVKGLTNLKWGYDTNYSNNYTINAQGKTTITLTKSGTSRVRTVYAQSTTDATYGNDPVSYATYLPSGSTIAVLGTPVRQYEGPNKIASCGVSFSKGKPVLKEDWTLHWTVPTINYECPIKGYQITLQKQSSGTTVWKQIPIKSATGSTLVTTVDGKYNTESDATSLKIGPKYYTRDGDETLEVDILKPGDKIRFSVIAYTKFGKNYDTGVAIFNNTVQPTYSPEYTIQNSGIMRVNVGGSWTEGQVYVNINGNWKEAEAVKVNVGGIWEDSE